MACIDSASRGFVHFVAQSPSPTSWNCGTGLRKRCCVEAQIYDE